MKETKIKHEKINDYLTVLKNTSFFKSMSEKNVKHLCEMMTEVSIAGGETLIKEGEKDFSMYILIFGRLYVKNESSTLPFAEICPGESVGEIAILTGSERTATVYARRDSLLLKLTKENYERFEKENLESALNLTKASLTRVALKKKLTLPGQRIRIITIAPAGDSDHTEFAQLLYQRLTTNYSAILIDRKLCDEHFQLQISQSDLNSDDTHPLLNWIQSLEKNYDFVILVSDRQMTPWTARCFRECDRVFFIADTKVHHALNSIELLYLQESLSDDKIYDLIFIQPQESEVITGTGQWFAKRSFSRYYHIKLKTPEHLDKIIRILTNSSIGIVLNGGGARGYSHLGVIRALLECKIPIDYLGGTSMGAIIGGSFVYGGLDRTMELLTKLGKVWKPDYTFPYIALYKGATTTNFLKILLDDVNIEDLWTNFFCISCNLSKKESRVHTTGKLWKALRMSLSLPAIFPPVYENGDMFIDGGIVNNMPIDEMRKVMKGGKIIGVNCSADRKIIPSSLYNTSHVSGWTYFLKSIFLDKEKRGQQNDIFNIITASIGLAGDTHQRYVSKDADLLIEIKTKKYGLLDFTKLNELEKIGYDTAMQVIKENFSTNGIIKA